VNQVQHNYWHRDPQYHLSVDEQKAALSGPEVVHVRIPLADEPGIELVPASHKQWDTEEELDVRLGRNEKSVHDPLSSSERVSLNAGDLLVFSANIIHRGIYGMDRLSLDVLFCDPEVELLKFVDEDCLPDAAVIASLENADAFRSTLATLRRATHCELSKP
jgi:ectoine hydroxylase-related dioxygenase (phytanoyl-CoA dioxygenase family)